MNAIEQALNKVPRIDGMEGAVLVEASTGHVVGQLRAEEHGRPVTGDHGDGTDLTNAVLAGAATDLVHTISLLTAQLASAGPFDELIVAFRRQHHIIRPLQASGHDDLFLLVTLDRRRANLALARHQLQAVESQIVA